MSPNSKVIKAGTSAARLKALSKKDFTLRIRRKRPPSTFGGNEDDELGEGADSPLKKLASMNAIA